MKRWMNATTNFKLFWSKIGSFKPESVLNQNQSRIRKPLKIGCGIESTYLFEKWLIKKRA